MIIHRAGFGVWAGITKLTGSPPATRTSGNAIPFGLVCRQKELNNVPGAEYIYSNSNYLFLAIIVQRVTGKELRAFTDPNIFEPAGMQQSLWRFYKEVVPGRALAYSKDGAKYFNNMPN